jgi:Fe2+ or Zn2+ uptake regulation protein
MFIKRTTQVPNTLIDTYLPRLTLAELKLLLVIIRQTYGWIDTNTGKRKTRDWITHRQFIMRTGLSRQTVSSTLDSLSDQGFVNITDFNQRALTSPSERQGKTKLFYALSDLEHVRLVNTTCKINRHQHVRIVVHNKTNSTKEKKTKGLMSIKDILKRLYRWK